MRTPSVYRLKSPFYDGDPADDQGRCGLMAQPGGLRGKVTGHTEVEPAMDLGGQGKDFGSHGSTSCKNFPA
jgi:hypothetical protein